VFRFNRHRDLEFPEADGNNIVNLVAVSTAKMMMIERMTTEKKDETHQAENVFSSERMLRRMILA
jgi:hypothetical protein